MAKPTSKPSWTVGNPSFGTITVEPSAGKKQNGFDVGERPPRQFLNWLFWIVNDWINYFEETTDGLLNLQGIYDAVVGVGGDFTTLTDLLLDPDYQAGSVKNILITSDQSVSAPLTFNQNDVNLNFKPGVNIIKGIGAAQAFIIDAERVRVLGGRFANFDGAGDIGIRIDATAKYTIISQCYFLNCDTTIDDLSATSSLAQNIEEV